MPSSASFVLHSSSNSSSKNDNNNMLKYLPDHDDSDSQNDGINNQIVELDDNWTMKNSNNRNKFSKLSNQGEATFLETEPNETSFLNSNRQQIVSLFIYLNILKNMIDIK